MTPETREQIRTAIGPIPAATDREITDLADVYRQMRDPLGPTGPAYGQIQARLTSAAPALIARVLEDADETAETPRLTADTVLFSADEHATLHVLLIKRAWDPYKDHWALPGGHVDKGEGTEDAARRELAEEVGLGAGTLRHVGVYAEPGRDPRGRYVTFAYAGFVPGMPQPAPATDAAEARWITVDEALGGRLALAFDHELLITDAFHARPWHADARSHAGTDPATPTACGFELADGTVAHYATGA